MTRMGREPVSATPNHIAAPIPLRIVSVILIGLGLTAVGFAAWVILDSAVKLPVKLLVYATFCGTQVLCQYLSVYRHNRIAALIAASVPLVACLAYAAPHVSEIFGQMSKSSSFVAQLTFSAMNLSMLLPRVLALGCLSIVMFVWFLSLREANARNLCVDSMVGLSRVPSSKFKSTIPLISLACVILFASFFVTPKHSGMPAAFGSAVQPIAWISALTVTLFAALLALICAGISPLGKRIGTVASSIALAICIAQLLFAFLGPDL